MKFHGGDAKMRNARGQQRAVSKVKMRGSDKIRANKNTSNKMFCEHIRQFPPSKQWVTRNFQVLVVQNNRKEMYKKS